MTERKAINLTGDRIDQYNDAREYFERVLDKDNAARLTDQRVVSLAFIALEYLRRLEADGVEVQWNVQFGKFQDRRTTANRHCASDCPCRTRSADAWLGRDIHASA